MASIAGSRISVSAPLSTRAKGKICVFNLGNKKVKTGPIHGFQTINGASNLKQTAFFGRKRSFSKIVGCSSDWAMRSTVEERVKKVVADQLEVKEEEVVNTASFIDLGADSLDAVELLMALEEEFDIEVPDESAAKITTVQAAIDFINSHAQ
ncbi:hypothetical protein LUZ60_011215 [Juncus effusus]|nr:hypothetical protein LUZ60_011215 [Juncus effusus]